MDRIVCKIFEQIREADGCLFGDSIDCVLRGMRLSGVSKRCVIYFSNCSSIASISNRIFSSGRRFP